MEMINDKNFVDFIKTAYIRFERSGTHNDITKEMEYAIEAFGAVITFADMHLSITDKLRYINGCLSAIRTWEIQILGDINESGRLPN